MGSWLEAGDLGGEGVSQQAQASSDESSRESWGPDGCRRFPWKTSPLPPCL